MRDKRENDNVRGRDRKNERVKEKYMKKGGLVQEKERHQDILIQTDRQTDRERGGMEREKER